MKSFFPLIIMITVLIFVANLNSTFADSQSPNDEKSTKQESMNKSEMHNQGKMMGNNHMSYMGMCAPGFVPLNDLCVLDDRCGPGAYPGKVCIMDGVMKPYLRPLQQKFSGISVEEIICAEGKNLMFKSHDATPGCFNSKSMEKLKHRGWQITKPAIACTLEYNPMCGMDGITYGNPCNLHAEHMALKHEGECSTTTPASTVEMIDGIQVVTIHASEFKFAPSDLQISSGKTKFVLVNDGVGEHELVVYEASKKDLVDQAELAEDEQTIADNILFEIEEVHPGESGESEVVDLTEGSYVMGCHVPGHYEAGMKGTLEIEE